MAYLKPQSPIKNGDDNIYPLTTYDQIIMPDGSRWDGSSSGAAPVSSVNGKTGNVTLTASDVKAMPDTYIAPVTSVNGNTGDVNLKASDVGAAAASHEHNYMPDTPYCIELNRNGALQGYGGFIDFHYNGSSSDYTSRIIESSSGVVDVSPKLTVGGSKVITAANFSLSGSTLTITTT